jgi:UPF0755 protein
MADEPTWDDLFGGEPVKPPVQEQPVQQQPVQQQPVQPPPVAPVQPTGSVPQPPVQPVAPPQPVQPVFPTQSVPSVPVQPAPTYQPSVPSPTVAAPTVPAPSYQPQQPTYASQLPPAPANSYTPPPADASRRQDRADNSARSGGGSGRGGSGRGGYRGQKPKRKLTWLWVLVVLFVLGAGGFGVVYAAFGPQIRHVMGWEPSIDYTSTTGIGKTTTITILPGQIGADVANSLAKAGVTKTSAAFYDLLLKQKKAPNFEPGTYRLGEQISAQTALTEISNPANRVVSKVVIPEGFNVQQILARLNSKTGVPLSELQAEAKNYTQFGLPAGAPSLEGFLFPATYDFDPGTSAKVMLQAMVTRMNVSLKSHDVAPADELRVLTLASIIQKEGGTNADFYKVSRVFTNRLAINMPLESDATVSYGAGSKTISTTGAQRADASNPYNTYAHTGLPIGPIASPGDTAIDAALHPVAGPWIYFVLVNGYTGETVYSTTAAGQAAGVKQWQAWLKAHPGYGS